MSVTAKSKLYNPRHPERTLLYQTVAEQCETWLELACSGQFDGQGDHYSPKPFVRQAFEKYLDMDALKLNGIDTIFGLPVHFHVCAVDGVFEEVAGEDGADTDVQARVQARSPGVIFHQATGVDAAAVAKVQATLRKRILRAFVGRGLLESFEAKEMLAYRHSGFSVDTSVCIAAHDHVGLERLLDATLCALVLVRWLYARRKKVSGNFSVATARCTAGLWRMRAR